MRLAKQSSLPEDPLAWLVRTARNLAIDASRRDNRRRRREQRFAETRQLWFDVSPGEEKIGEAEDVMAALQQLTPEDRDLVIAHIWNGMSFRQIAVAFGISSSTANRQYHLALEKIRQVLTPVVTAERQSVSSTRSEIRNDKR